ncbi:MAG: hypothetical protein KDC80_12140 [Saprospiraceae bacterium]|nr:hypothetical protein [Saprospiraceae bacterium]
MVRSIFTLLCTTFLLSCQSLSEEAIQGEWKARSVIEEGDTLDLDLSNVHLTISEDNFKYRHTQRDSLSGKFDLSKDLIELYVAVPRIDTIVIQVVDLAASSMVLRMNHEGKERLVTMNR